VSESVYVSERRAENCDKIIELNRRLGVFDFKVKHVLKKLHVIKEKKNERLCSFD